MKNKISFLFLLLFNFINSADLETKSNVEQKVEAESVVSTKVLFRNELGGEYTFKFIFNGDLHSNEESISYYLNEAFESDINLSDDFKEFSDPKYQWLAIMIYNKEDKIKPVYCETFAINNNPSSVHTKIDPNTNVRVVAKEGSLSIPDSYGADVLISVLQLKIEKLS